MEWEDSPDREFATESEAWEQAQDEREAKHVEDLVDSLDRAIQAAYSGSAEHGGFLRGTGHEYVPSPFMVLNQLRHALHEQNTPNWKASYEQACEDADELVREIRDRVNNVQGKAMGMLMLTPEGQRNQAAQIERELEEIHTAMRPVYEALKRKAQAKGR